MLIFNHFDYNKVESLIGKFGSFESRHKNIIEQNMIKSVFQICYIIKMRDVTYIN